MRDSAFGSTTLLALRTNMEQLAESKAHWTHYEAVVNVSRLTKSISEDHNLQILHYFKWNEL